MLKGFGAIALVVVLLVVAVVGYGWYRFNQIGREDLALADSGSEVQNFLIVGSDTRADMLTHFSESPENQANVIGQIDNGMLFILRDGMA